MLLKLMIHLCVVHTFMENYCLKRNTTFGGLTCEPGSLARQNINSFCLCKDFYAFLALVYPY